VPIIGSLDFIRLSSAEAGRKKALADMELNVNSPTEKRSFAKLLDTQKCVPHLNWFSTHVLNRYIDQYKTEICRVSPPD